MSGFCRNLVLFLLDRTWAAPMKTLRFGQQALAHTVVAPALCAIALSLAGHVSSTHAVQPPSPAAAAESQGETTAETTAEATAQPPVAPMPPEVANPAAIPVAPTPEGDFPPESLAAVEDFTGLDRPGERDVYYGLLNLAGQVPLSVQRARAKAVATAGEAAFRADPKQKGRPYSQFADLVLSPGRYRGKPVTMEGYIQKLDRMDAGENEYGLTDLYQSYLFTPESKGNPVVVVTREVTPGLPRPTKGNATNYIRVTGYFYKIWRYDAERGGWAAPLLIANRLEYRPPQRGPFDDLIRTATSVGAVAVFVGLVLTLWVRNRNARRDRERLRKSPSLATPDFVAFDSALPSSAPNTEAPSPPDVR